MAAMRRIVNPQRGLPQLGKAVTIGWRTGL